MNTSSSSFEPNVINKNSTEETIPSGTFTTQEPSVSPDNDTIAILRKRRIRRGRAIAATAASYAAARIAANS
ncbi:MAG: hypothetical protein NPIRA05_02730 [Nitrospirales bacterium]|nr:MAG: hypothetical protein NPIRA05_02730 [Nitrospirales bacterium]